MRKHAFISAAAVAALALSVTGCSVSAKDDDSNAAATGTPTSHASGGAAKIRDVVLVTHDSWFLPKKLIAQFEKQTGYHLVVRASGDAGKLTNKLVLTQGNPTGDVSFGIDNTFASRALTNNVFAAYTPATVPPGVSDYDVEGDDGQHLTPIDHANVCVNVDTTWFAAHHLPAPKTLDDLVDPAYKGLFVTPGATTSSPGMAFLLATIATYGDAWPDYWTKLMANGAEIADGWDQAYEVDFTQGGGHGKKPIVLSYDSSPAFTVKDGTSTTQALLDTCFGSNEYAGVLNGAKNVPGAEAFVDWLLTPAVQSALPDSMYVFPVVAGTPLPKAWAKFAVMPTEPLAVSPTDIDAKREKWLQQWSDVTSR
ncbi:thiamine ABC transporter substrate-binding protein [Nocardioides nematodiphilus]|uniref:thiamine ABC transporter substrate-binding protein n=1 Tax=Nocardioides nematodiphilus TaxID=2849669 RepID=UPI001CD94D9A|nr:thiamine ABC transporter substrate-binding protein [Nocardioides nematodiphilus]MCA1981648.1 thiamine ABC transporter substrate-binding protein [Nocardioides nematodiphilus]